MAAADPSESPKRHKSLAEEVETSGGADVASAAAAASGNGLKPTDRAASGEASEGAGGERAAALFTGHSERLNVESGATEADKTTRNSPEKMACDTAAPGGERRSDTEDEDGETRARTGEKKKSDLDAVAECVEEKQRRTRHGAKNTAQVEEINEKENSCDGGKKSVAKAKAAAPGKDAYGAEEEEEEDEEADHEEDAADLTTKPKKSRMVCKECGKVFNRRETFNLHRHFHAHEDELTPLTCKECGLTFQHRSGLIKHRNEHLKQKEQQQLLSVKKEVETTEEINFACGQCRKVFCSVDKLRDHTCSNAVDKPYHCPLCRQEFQFKISITKHMMSHSQENMLKCRECNQMFANSISLRYHQRCHSAHKPYECPECGMVFKHYSVMKDHRRKHTDNTRSHLCNVCGKTFKYGSLLHQHQYLHTGQKTFHCPECGKKFAFAQNMKAHFRQHRLRKSNALSTTELPGGHAPTSVQEPAIGPGKENANQNEDATRTFSCPLCPQSCPSPAHLRAHLLVHEAEYEMLERKSKSPKEAAGKFWEKGHICPHCPSIYRDESSLNVHLLSVHKSVAQYLENVSQEPKKLPLSNDTSQAKWRSDGSSIKPYKCTECGKAFRHRSVLELHMRIHPRDKPYQCKVCGKGFRFSSYLQQHLIIHTGKKPYKCPECGKDFAFLQNMKTHQKLHQEKPFRCTSCRKGYSDETQLQHHMLSHNGDKPHKCDLCDKSFGLAYLLRDHMNTHTGERPHRCDECHKSFSWFSSLLVHQKIHARKRQGLSQYNSFPTGTRTRGRGGRGRRGGRSTWGSSRLLGSGVVSSHLPPYSDSALRDTDMHGRAAQPQSSMLPIHMDLQGRQQKEPWMPKQPVQWKVDGGEVMPVQSSQHITTLSGLQHHQRGPDWTEGPLISQSGSTSSAHSLDSSHIKESLSSLVLPKKPSSLDVSEIEQHRKPVLVTWSGTHGSTVVAAASPPNYIDGAALWSIRPALLPQNLQSALKIPSQELQKARWQGASSNLQVTPLTVSQPEKPRNSSETEKQRVSGSAGVSTSGQIDQSGTTSFSTPPQGVGGTLWDLPTPPGAPKTLNSSEKLASNSELSQKHTSSSWAGAPSQTATQKAPISIQYEPHRFGQGIGAPVWGFQSNPGGAQTLLTGQLKAGNGAQELQQQQQPIVTGTQIIINQASPFFSPPLAPLPPLALPGPHPLHSVAVGALPRPGHPNIFFTPQAVMSERPQVPQTLPLPQLAPRTEPHKLGSRLPFPPERLLKCMICGCSLPRELDLQMHYLQHAQGEI